MFQMNANDQAMNRYIQYDGMVHYYKHGWLSNKWIVVYAKLWSDSTLEWFQSKGSDKPAGSIFLNSVIPYICIGSQVRKVPTKKPKVEASWNRNLLMAIATDQKASSVHWLYFDDGNNLRRWLSEMTKTLPRLNAPAVPYPRNDRMVDAFANDYDRSRPLPNAFAPPPMMAPMDNQGMHVSFQSNHQHPRKRSSFDCLFDDTMMNYGLGSFYFPMDFKDSSSDSDSDSDDDIRRHQKSSGHTTVFNDGNVHVSQFGDATAITLRAGEDRDQARAHPTSNEFGSGFPKVHHIEL